MNTSSLRRTRLIGCTLLAMAVFTASCGKKKEEEGQVEQRPEYINPVLGYLKMASPKALVEDITVLTQKLDTTGQAAFMLPMLLSQFGYPEFEGMSPTSDVALFFLLDPETENAEPGGVLLLHSTPESAIAQAIAAKSQGVMRSVGEWLIVAPDDADMALVKDDQELITLAREPRTRDIELTLLPDGLIEAEDQIMEKVRTQTMANPEMPEPVKAWIEPGLTVFFDEFGATENVVFGLDLSPEAISFALNFQALDGTPLGLFLSQDSAGRVSGGDFIPDEFSIAMVGDFDAAATRVYNDHIFDALLAVAPDGSDDDLSRLKELNAGYYGRMEGPLGMGLSLRQLKANYVQHTLGDFDEAHIRDVYGYTYGTLMPAIMTTLSQADPTEQPVVEFAFQPDAGEIDGVPYHKATQKMELPEDEITAMPELRDIGNQEVYISVVDGDTVIATDLDRFSDLLSRVKSGSPSENSISRRLGQAAPGVVLQGYVDLVNYYLEIVTGLPRDPNTPSQLQAIIPVLEKLRGSELDPATFRVKVGSSRLDSEFNIAVSTLRAVIEAATPQAPQGGM